MQVLSGIAAEGIIYILGRVRSIGVSRTLSGGRKIPTEKDRVEHHFRQIVRSRITTKATLSPFKVTPNAEAGANIGK